MERDAILGYIIKSLEKNNKTKKEIEKILETFYILEEEIDENEARSIFYEFPEEQTKKETNK